MKVNYSTKQLHKTLFNIIFSISRFFFHTKITFKNSNQLHSTIIKNIQTIQNTTVPVAKSLQYKTNRNSSKLQNNYIKQWNNRLLFLSRFFQTYYVQAFKPVIFRHYLKTYELYNPKKYSSYPISLQENFKLNKP